MGGTVFQEADGRSVKENPQREGAVLMGNKKKISFKEDENGCFNVTSHAKVNGGYHRIKVNYKSVMLHRFVYENLYGWIPNDLIVRHKCDNPSCINPEHLELGTPKDNMMDKVKRNRCNTVYGERVKNSKLNNEKVMEIRYLLNKGESLSSVAKKYDVSAATISRVKEGISWAKVRGTKEPEEKGSFVS
jgi:HNH endonuclease/Trp repressor protein